jgi:hypothetical protein
MAKKVLKKYRVQRRIEVWAEVEITAENFDAAVVQAKELRPEDFVTAVEEMNDTTWLPGFGVQEQW